MLDKGTTFIFGFWICIANGSGGFNSHLADTREPEASVATQCSRLNEFVDNLDEMLLPDLASEIEEKFIFDAISTRAAQDFSYRIQSDLGKWSQCFSGGLRL
jgi:hypothetical protein